MIRLENRHLDLDHQVASPCLCDDACHINNHLLDTPETNILKTLKRYGWCYVSEKLIQDPGSSFLAIQDPGSGISDPRLKNKRELIENKNFLIMKKSMLHRFLRIIEL
jgi:hypothetical protein